jgi:hypothetical protein
MRRVRDTCTDPFSLWPWLRAMLLILYYEGR